MVLFFFIVKFLLLNLNSEADLCRFTTPLFQPHMKFDTTPRQIKLLSPIATKSFGATGSNRTHHITIAKGNLAVRLVYTIGLHNSTIQLQN